MFDTAIPSVSKFRATLQAYSWYTFEIWSWRMIKIGKSQKVEIKQVERLKVKSPRIIMPIDILFASKIYIYIYIFFFVDILFQYKCICRGPCLLASIPPGSLFHQLLAFHFSKPNDASPDQNLRILFYIPSCDSSLFRK